MAAINLPISKCTHAVTIHVTGLQGWKFRLKIAQALFWLGARVAGVGIIFESDTQR